MTYDKGGKANSTKIGRYPQLLPWKARALAKRIWKNNDNSKIPILRKGTNDQCVKQLTDEWIKKVNGKAIVSEENADRWHRRKEAEKQLRLLVNQADTTADDLKRIQGLELLIERLKKPIKQLTIWDTEQRGLGLMVSATGPKSFRSQYHLHGQWVTRTIGRFGEVVIDDSEEGANVRWAREQVRQDRIKAKEGIDPREKSVTELAEGDTKVLTAFEVYHHALLEGINQTIAHKLATKFLEGSRKL